MDSILIENVRCFAKTHNIPLAKLTFIVGENSSGKSSFLSIVRMAWDLANGAGPYDFNEEPFQLGMFDQIVTQLPDANEKCNSFVVGCSFKPQGHINIKSTTTITGHFRRSGVQPTLSKCELRSGDYHVKSEVGELDPAKPKALTAKLSINLPSLQATFSNENTPYYLGPNILRTAQFAQHLFGMYKENTTKEKRKLADGQTKKLFQLAITLQERLSDQRPYATAPIRTKPLRTYDITKETHSPSGEHTPMILARARTDKTEWKSLQTKLIKFGEACGRFNMIDIRPLGDELVDPFQIQIKTSGLQRNLVDVGYGVSQLLPILVDLIVLPRQTMFLLQQPEVHLHPRAQSELGSLLTLLSTEEDKRFVVETHSDYIIDRVKAEIRKAKIDPDDVLILFFDRKADLVEVHPIRFDNYGNVLDAPDCYRKFFLEEEKRIFGG